jgi:sialidase-1
MKPTPRDVVAFSPSQEAVRKNQQPCMLDRRIRTRSTPRAVALLAGVLASADFCAWAESDVFVSGTGGYSTYRIPAIVRAPNGTLLAFGEGRPSSSDTGNIDIVLRRSTDNGTTWGTMTVVRDEGTTSATNPSPVVDETTGRMYLHYSYNISRPFYVFTDDNGATWSAPVEITATAKATGWGYCVPGPGHGIQLKRGAQAGRLLVPSHHYLTSGAKGIHAVYSDDHGATWFYGSVANAAGGINPDECQAVELVSPAAGGGSQVYFNIRDESGSAAGNRTTGKILTKAGAGNQTVTVNLTDSSGNPLANTKLFLRARATTP